MSPLEQLLKIAEDYPIEMGNPLFDDDEEESREYTLAELLEEGEDNE